MSSVLAERLGVFWLSVHSSRVPLVANFSDMVPGAATNGLCASVVVPVRNGGADLQRLLEALRRQTIPTSRFELVIGDDGSTDGSTDDVEREPWVVVTRGRPMNSYAARNRAVAASDAPILAFCDADCVPEPEWLEEGLRALESADLVAGLVPFHRARAADGLDAPRHGLLQGSRAADEAGHGRDRQSLPAANAVRSDDRIRRQPARARRLRLCWTVGGRRGVARCFRPRSCCLAPDSKPCPSVPPLALDLQPLVRGSGKSRRPATRGPDAPRRPAAGAARSAPAGASGRSIGPDRRWLGANGVRPRPLENAVALPLMYLLVPYLRGVAQIRGWFDGRRLR